MKITVTFETAKALRDAGFPQPESVAKGQYWYSANGGEDMLFSVVSFLEETTKTVKKKGWIFAPQAHDVLEQLGWEFYLLFDQTAPQWICNQPSNEVGIWTDKNPHEAAAKAYLQLHKPA